MATSLLSLFLYFLKYLFNFLAAPGLSCSAGSLVAVCKLSCSMWDLDPCPGIEPGPPMLEHRVLATGPPGKALCLCLYAASPLCVSFTRTSVIGFRAQSKSRMISSQDPEAMCLTLGTLIGIRKGRDIVLILFVLVIDIRL